MIRYETDGQLHKRDNGTLVSYANYAILQARVEKLESAVHSARSFILPWTSDCDYTAESDLKYACEILLAATEGEINNDQD